MRVDITEPRIRAVREAVQIFGGQQRMADALGITQQLVNDWARGRKPVSGRLAIEIEEKTAAMDRCIPVERLLPGWKWNVVRGRASLEQA